MRASHSLQILLIATQMMAMSARNGASTAYSDMNATDLSLLPKWLLLEENLKQLSRGVASNVRPYFMEAVRQRNITSRCVEQSLHVFAGMEEMKLWAMRFLDSSAKQIDGILDMTWASFGRYDECVSTVVMDKKLGKEKEHSSFTGQYCLMALKPHISETKLAPFGRPPIDELKHISETDSALSVLAKESNAFAYFPMFFGICVPSGCDQQDVDKIASFVGEKNGIIISSANCEVKQENQYTPKIITALTCYCILIFLAIIGTLLDVYEKRRNTSFKSTGSRLLLAFSVKSNFSNLFNTKRSAESVKCLHAFRVISMCLLIICHGLFFRPMQLSHNMISFGNTATSFLGQIITNGTLQADSFFFLGGFLLGYIAMRHKIKMKKFVTFPQFVIVRLCRLCPSILFTIMTLFLTPLMSSGPIWGMMFSHFVQPCYRDWWTVLLFINNFYYRETMCMPTLWYLACDMQLYIIAFLFLSLLIKTTKFGMAITTMAIIASMCCVAIITYVKEFPPTLTLDVLMDIRPALLGFFKYLYFLPVDHVGPYFIGMMTGVYLATKPEIKFSKVTLTLGWCTAITVSMSVLFGVLPWNRGEKASMAEAIIYASCSRVAWALSAAWLVVCCTSGYGGIVNHILSWNVWVPLSRLSFSVYLIHPIIQVTAAGAVDTVLPSKQLFLYRCYVADITISYVCAILVYLMVEAPFATISILLFRFKPDLKKDEPTLKAANHHLSQENNHVAQGEEPT